MYKSLGDILYYGTDGDTCVFSKTNLHAPVVTSNATPMATYFDNYYPEQFKR